MKKLLLLSVLLCVLCGSGFSQNLTTVSGSNITDINGSKLAAGQVCFLITDQQDNPISVSIGGGGQALKRGYCSAVTAGVITGFTVPNPAATAPSGIYYRITVKDSSTGQEVLRYTQVSFTGATFNFDNYAPLNLGNFAALSGNAVTGNLSVTGNVAATGTVTGSNIPGTIPGTGACTNQFVRVLNNAAPPTCSTVGSSDLASGLTLTGVTNTSNLIVNPSSTSTGAALTVGGTSSTTGGMSIFVGALGSGTERAAIYPADGGSAAYRVGSLSVRTVSAGLLTGAETASISSAGAIIGTSVTTGKLNNTFTLDGTKYAQNNTGLHSAATDCITQLGGMIVIPSGVQVSLTSQLVLGNNTTKPPCELRIQNGGSLSIGTLGAGVDAIQAGDSSGVVCEGWGVGVGSGTGATTQCIQFGASSTFNALIAPLDRTGTQEAYYVIGAKILGNCSATIGSSIFDIQGVFAGTRILHVYTAVIPGKVLRIRPGTSVLKIASDVVIDGNLDSAGCSGGLPISIEGASASEISGITFRGEAQHPGATLPSIKIDGAGQAAGTGAHSIHFEGAYHVESINTPATCQVSIADSAHVAFDQPEVSGPTGTSLVCISQTVSNATHDIEIRHIRQGGWTNVINNSISSFTSGSDIHEYHYGGGAVGAGGKGLLIYDTLPIQIGTEPISAAPRMEWGSYEQSAVATGTLASFIPDKAIMVTRIDVSWITATANCTVAPQIIVTDGTNPVTMSVSNATVQQTATFSQNYAAGVRLNLNTVAGTCTTQPAVTNIAVEYKMQ